MNWVFILFFCFLMAALTWLVVGKPSWTEGFMAPIAGASELDNVTMCAARTSCSDCINETTGGGCGWCVASSSCVPKEGGRCGGDAKPDTDANLCTDVQCDIYTSCETCTRQSKCGWCPDQGRCVTKSLLPISVPGASLPPIFIPNPMDGKHCSVATFVTAESKCVPKKKCSTIKSCEDCVKTEGCGYCSPMSKCMDIQKEDECMMTDRGGGIDLRSLLRSVEKCGVKEEEEEERPELAELRKLAEAFEAGPLTSQ